MATYPPSPTFPAPIQAPPFPRMSNLYLYGLGGVTVTPATFQRFGLVVSNGPGTDTTTLKQKTGQNTLTSMYFSGMSTQVDTVTNGAPLFNQLMWPGWYATNSGTYLAAPITSAATTCTVVSTPLGCGWNVGWNGSNPSTESLSLVPFPALLSTPGHATDEIVVVTNVSGNTLTITRGNWKFLSSSSNVVVSQAAAQVVGTRIAALPSISSAYLVEFYANITSYCPLCTVNQVDSITGINPYKMRFLDYMAAWVDWYINTHYTTTTYGGVTVPLYDSAFIDNANSTLAFPNANLDADQNNVLDGLGGPDGRGVYNGLSAFLGILKRKLIASSAVNGLPAKLILTNGSPWPGQSEGMLFEGYPYVFSASPSLFPQQTYFDRLRALSPDTLVNPISIINPDLFLTGTEGSSASGTTGDYAAGFTSIGPGGGTVTPTSSQYNANNVPIYMGWLNYTALRFFLTQAFMTNAYISYDWSPTMHGQTWSCDEIDKGAGTTLSATITAASSALPVVSGGTAFTNGMIVRVPHAAKETSGTWATQTEDELMLVGAGATATSIPVTRAQSSTIAGTQVKGTKVLPDYGTGSPSWYGWMGNALGPATNNYANLGANILPSNAGLETSVVVKSAAAAAQTGTWPNTDTFTGWTINVGNNNVKGFTTADTITFNPNKPNNGTSPNVPGIKAARLQITTTDTGSYNYYLKPPGTTLAINTTYTFSWWAKGDRQQSYQVRIVDGAGSTMATLQTQLTNVWTQYYLVYTVGGTIATNGFSAEFEVANETGLYWFDDCSVQLGDINIWSRDFENAYVIFNGTNSSQVITLPAITSPAGTTYTTYKKITGTQDSTTNSGATVAVGATVTIPARDGLVLTKA